MKIVIAHYHLNRGGVAQVVQNHLSALEDPAVNLDIDEVVLCHGGRASGWPADLPSRISRFKVAECVVPGLDYDTDVNQLDCAGQLARDFEATILRFNCKPENCVVHFHNHSLGKNVSLPNAVNRLADDGYRLVLQIHDFAEDYRPSNYRRMADALAAGRADRLADVLYPQAPHVHYCVLNSRDHSILKDAGIAANRLHLLPNPVRAPERLSDRSAAKSIVAKQFGINSAAQYILYPVRGIRRKNLGEFLLWSAVCPSDAVFGLTLPPLNPVELPSYERWRAVSGALGLPALFEVGGETGLSLPQNLTACDHVLTTSLAEGFGLVFLESCLSDRPLIGRNLPEITDDFVDRGVRFSGLRSRLAVPIEWIDWKNFLEFLAREFNATLTAFGLPPVSESQIVRGAQEKLDDECVDFGDLSSDHQEQIIRKVWQDSTCRDRLLQLNEWICDAVSDNNPKLIAETSGNAAVVEREFSLAATGRQLSEIYQNLMLCPPAGTRQPLNAANQILTAFLNFTRFHPVRL
jgi:hypothetical protein